MTESFTCVGAYLLFTIGYHIGRNRMRKELYKEYKLRTDRGAESLAIDILVNTISR